MCIRDSTIWDKELGAYRRAQYGDIVILLRSVSGWAEEFIEVLATQGIPAVAESRTGYFNTLEVETVLNLLAVIDNPMQDIPLAVSYTHLGVFQPQSNGARADGGAGPFSRST